ncbi:hypothetical protein [Streptomyces sp. NPDC001770]
MPSPWAAKADVPDADYEAVEPQTPVDDAATSTVQDALGAGDMVAVTEADAVVPIAVDVPAETPASDVPAVAADPAGSWGVKVDVPQDVSGEPLVDDLVVVVTPPADSEAAPAVSVDYGAFKEFYSADWAERAVAVVLRRPTVGPRPSADARRL